MTSKIIYSIKSSFKIGRVNRPLKLRLEADIEDAWTDLCSKVFPLGHKFQKTFLL